MQLHSDASCFLWYYIMFAMNWTRNTKLGLAVDPSMCFMGRDFHTNSRCTRAGTYFGCYNKNCSFQISTTWSSNTMDMDVCLNRCFQAGYRYAGLYNGTDCLCGCSPLCKRALGEDKCGIPCPGLVSTFCGGLTAVQVYEQLDSQDDDRTFESVSILDTRINTYGAVEECTMNNISVCIQIHGPDENNTLVAWADSEIVAWTSATGIAGDALKYLKSTHSLALPQIGPGYCGYSNETDLLKREIFLQWDLKSGPSCTEIGFICIQLNEVTSAKSDICYSPLEPMCQQFSCQYNLELKVGCEDSNCSCVPRAVVYHSTNLTSEEKLSVINEISITAETADEVLEEVISITDGDVRSEDLALTTNVLETVVSLKSTDSEITTDVVTIIDNLLDSDPEQLVEAQEKNRSSSRAMQALEQQLEFVDLTKTNGSLKVVKPNLVVEVKRTSNDDLQSGITFISNVSSTGIDPSDSDIGIVDEDNIDEKNIEAGIRVQSYSPLVVDYSALNVSADNASDVRVAFSVVRQPRIFDSSDKSLLGSEAKCLNPKELKPNTPIVSVTVHGNAEETLQTNVTTYFHPILENNNHTVIDHPVCVYWDYSADGGRGAWSSFGCRLVKGPTTNNLLLKCQCNHTSNFAVLMRVHEIKTSTQFKEASRLLSYIGCALSIASLFITLCVYGFSVKLRQKQPNQIFMNICASLLLLYVVFVVVIALEHGEEGEMKKESNDDDANNECVSPENKLLWCDFLAALVQYFTLTTLTWMAVEGFNMYLLFVRVVNSHIRAFMIKAALFAWGFPAVIVIVTGAIAQDEYTLQNVCFVSLKPQIFGLLTPVGIILLVNIIIYIIVVVRLSRTLSAKKASKDGGMSEAWQRLQKALCIFLLLGLTWSFGYLLLIDHASNQIFQIVFIVFNSFQGFLIFVLYCLRQPLVRQEMARCCVCFACFSPEFEYRGMMSSFRRSSRSTVETSATSGSRMEQSETSFTKLNSLPRPKGRFPLFNKYF